MALNPEIVANILQVSLNNHCRGRWDLVVSAHEIEARAVARTTTPQSFADWLSFKLLSSLQPDIERDVWKRQLVDELQRADMTRTPEDMRTKEHRILMVESRESQMHAFMKLLKWTAENEYQIPVENLQVNCFTSTPEDKGELYQAIRHHTGVILHNLTETDLAVIVGMVNANSDIARDFALKMVIVKSVDASTQLMKQFLLELEHKGVMVIPKPFPSQEEVIKVLLGVV